MRALLSRAVVPLLVVSSVFYGCASTSITGDAALNHGNWPICSALGAVAAVVLVLSKAQLGRVVARQSGHCLVV
ncbi:MAG: hypothetical protein ACI9EB_001471 [Pseudomonas sp.]|jgi:hypothetical protein